MLRVKLRIKIEGVGITIQTKPNYNPPPLTLKGGGIPLFLTGSELYDYFLPQNLDFSGISKTQFVKRHPPSGWAVSYQRCSL